MKQDRSLQGIALCSLAYLFLALQDAVVKWLVADYSVFTILFWRSLVVVVACLIAGRMGLVRSAWTSLSRRLLIIRGLLSLLAWLLYYTAAMDWAFDALDWTRIIHCIDPANLPSQKVAQRLGSTLLGPGRMPDPFSDLPIELWGQTRDQWRARPR